MNTPLRAVLFDLDGTLLGNDMDRFLPPYLERISAHVAHLVPPKKFVADLLRSTGVMAANDGRASNEEVFAQDFYPRLGVPREALEPLLIDFYQTDFDKLRQYTERKPAARRVVRRAFDLGYDVVIATNPLFPRVAVRRRLEWAGVADFPYTLITTYENSHACKPDLRYFEEILVKIDRPAAACLVVGDEAMDMVAARLGCRTFLVPGPRTALDLDIPQPTYQGPLAEVEDVLVQLSSHKTKPGLEDE
ncbi:MAG: HAD family hydrolase [Chloroflexia bacterium]|nr:HAD family hydrolase [Chloroflexia bacterium]